MKKNVEFRWIYFGKLVRISTAGATKWKENSLRSLDKRRRNHLKVSLDKLEGIGESGWCIELLDAKMELDTPNDGFGEVMAFDKWMDRSTWTKLSNSTNASKLSQVWTKRTPNKELRNGRRELEEENYEKIMFPKCQQFFLTIFVDFIIFALCEKEFSFRRYPQLEPFSKNSSQKVTNRGSAQNSNNHNSN